MFPARELNYQHSGQRASPCQPCQTGRQADRQTNSRNVRVLPPNIPVKSAVVMHGPDTRSTVFPDSRETFTVRSRRLRSWSTLESLLPTQSGGVSWLSRTVCRERMFTRSAMGYTESIRLLSLKMEGGSRLTSISSLMMNHSYFIPAPERCFHLYMKPSRALFPLNDFAISAFHMWKLTNAAHLTNG